MIGEGEIFILESDVMVNQSSDLTHGPLLKRIVFYTIPIILTGVLQLLFNSADMIVVGQNCGSISVGAVGATGPVINLLVNLFIGFSVGSGVTCAHGNGIYRQEYMTDVSAMHHAYESSLLRSQQGAKR